jgi:hypothetical protein
VVVSFMVRCIGPRSVACKYREVSKAAIAAMKGGKSEVMCDQGQLSK